MAAHLLLAGSVSKGRISPTAPPPGRHPLVVILKEAKLGEAKLASFGMTAGRVFRRGDPFKAKPAIAVLLSFSAGGPVICLMRVL